MNKYCDVKKFSNNYLHKVGPQFDNAIYEMIKDRFCVNAIPIPENATNGDMIKAIFPNKEYKTVRKLSGCDYVEVRLDEYNRQEFELDWWNAHYNAESEDKESCNNDDWCNTCEYKHQESECHGCAKCDEYGNLIALTKYKKKESEENMNKQEILDEIATLKERLNSLEKMYDSLTPPNKRWRAEKDDMYFYIDSEDDICSSLENGAITDKLRYDTGNYFKTMKEAEFEVERLKVIAELKGYATPVNEFNWSSNFEIKYVLIVGSNEEGNNILVVDDWRTYQFSDLCFASEEVAKSAIEAVGEDRIIKYYFRRGENNGDSD